MYGASLMSTINPLLSMGDHLIAQRFGYTHHGLYLGDGNVLEYILHDGITIVPLETFANGHEIYIREHKNAPYLGSKAVARGMMRLGENHYNLLTRNCEHFVNWCIEGVENSRQVDNLILTIIPFYSIFQKSDFLKGCLKFIFDDPSALDQAVSRINKQDKRACDPFIRAKELSEDIFGSQHDGIINLATLITTASQFSKEYESWAEQNPHEGLKKFLSRSMNSIEDSQGITSKEINLDKVERVMNDSFKVINLAKDLLHNPNPDSSTKTAQESTCSSAATTQKTPRPSAKVIITPYRATKADSSSLSSSKRASPEHPSAAAYFARQAQEQASSNRVESPLNKSNLSDLEPKSALPPSWEH